LKTSAAAARIRCRFRSASRRSGRDPVSGPVVFSGT
jgi:hypothetical protein